MRQLLQTFLLILLVATAALAQNTGKIIGVIKDQTTKEPLPFVPIKILQQGTIKTTTTTDADGAFKTAPLEPGKYDLEATFVGYTPLKMTGIQVSSGGSTALNKLTMGEAGLTTDEVVITAYKVPVINPTGSTGHVFRSEDIKNLPTRDLNSIINLTPGVYSADAGAGLNIRGNRSGDNAVFVNGVRIFGSALPPPEALEEAAVMTGGVSAQYGDALGGVISYTTKSAARRFTAGVIAETSRPFDQWNYDLLGLTFSGPIIKKTETTETGKYDRTLLGYFLTLQYTGFRTEDPNPYGFWRLNDRALEEQRTNPWDTRTGRPLNKGYFYTQNDLVNQKYRPNDQRHNINLNTTIDYQPTANSILSVGATGAYTRNTNGSNFNLANFENNSVSKSYSYNGFVRFRQSFNNSISDTGALLKNVFYQVQFDIGRVLNTTEDERHGKDLSKYNYYGKFTQLTRNDTLSGAGARQAYLRVDPLTGQTDSLYVYGRAAGGGNRERRLVLLDRPNGLRWEPSSFNPVLANYNTSLINVYNTELANNVLSSASLFDIGSGALTGLGFGTNGQAFTRPGFSYREKASTFGNYSALGTTLSGYNISNQDQFRATLQTGADIGKHTIRFGLEALQRFESGYSGPTNMFARGRALLNTQILGNEAGFQVDTFTTTVAETNAQGQQTFVDYLNVRTRNIVNRDANGNVLGQSDFDRNLRRTLGLNPNGNDVVNIDALDPNLVNINLFSVSDLMNDGQRPFASWQGYDAYGNRRPLFGSRSSFNDFFTDTVNRPIDAFRPIYLAGYIEDNFEIEDLNIRVGLRVDRFDANQQVLKDKYSLTRLRTVGETDMSQFAGNFQRPGNIGDDAVIYVDRSADEYTGNNQNQFRVLGFRSGDQWFRADGSPTTNPRELETNGQVQPWFDATGITDPVLQRLQRSNRITLDAFTPYKPQWVVSPRLAFSFPISEDALFYAHYDIKTQRPASYNGNSNFASPLDYYAISRAGSFIYDGAPQAGAFISNPNLRPQRNIDYQFGFQQRLTQSSALKFSMYYQEIKDLIQVQRINQAYPITYTTDANQDFGVTKGLTLEYDLRRTQNLTLNTSYTLQFAETSASSFAASQLAQTNNPNLRNTVPASWDSRHGLKLTIDYRYGPGQGPELGRYRPLENFGVNVTTVANSGTPYTRYQNQFFGTNVEGAVNGNRLPWNYRVGLRVNKTFFLGGKESGEGEARTVSRRYTADVYVYVQNLFNRRNVLAVYNRTGSATNDGYLLSSLGQQEAANSVGAPASNAAAASTYALYYNLWILNPDFISQPRWVRLGVNVNF